MSIPTFRRSSLLLVAVGLAPLAGCSKSSPSGSSPAASSSVTGASAPAHASGAASPGASAGAAAAGSPAAGACAVVGSTLSIAKGARAETGATAARIADGRIVVGYAVGNAVRASVYDPAAGSATPVDVEDGSFAGEVKAMEKGSSLNILRVTPVGAKDVKMRVLVDATITGADKAKHARCGFADADPIVGGAAASSGGDGGAPGDQVNSCRTFTDGKKTWVLSSWTRAAEGGKSESRWVVYTSGDDGAAYTETVLGAKGAPDPKQDRWGFELPASAHDADVGYVFASRYNGNLVLARKGEGPEPAGELSLNWFGAAAGCRP